MSDYKRYFERRGLILAISVIKICWVHYPYPKTLLFLAAEFDNESQNHDICMVFTAQVPLAVAHFIVTTSRRRRPICKLEDCQSAPKKENMITATISLTG